MSIRPGLALLQNAATPQTPETVVGSVVSAPASFNSPLKVRLPGWQPNYYRLVYDWPACHGDTLPAAGAEVILRDQLGQNLRCLWWDGSYSGTPFRTAQLLMSAFDNNPASTDQTAAFSLAYTAAAAMVASGVSSVDIILDSRQKYTLGQNIVAGANGEYAQVPFPFDNAHTGKIRLVGRPRGNDISYIGTSSGTVIESTLTAPTYNAANGIASIFGGPSSYCTGHAALSMYPAGWNHLQFGFRDITIRQASPTLCGIDGGFVGGITVDGLLQFDTDQMASVNPQTFSLAGLTVCTAPQAIAMVCPFSLNWYGVRADTIVVSGWTHGLQLGEYARINELTCFFLSGAMLGVDSSQQVSRIEYLTDWNNAYGIAQFSPSSATPVSPALACPGSQNTGIGVTPVSIGDWDQQTSAGGGAPAGTAKVYDVMDANQLTFIDALWSAKTDGSTILTVPVIFGLDSSGSGTSTISFASRQRIVTKLNTVGRQAPSMPASGTAIRNPFGRDALVNLSGGTVSNVQVNSLGSIITASPGVFVVPANAFVKLTYTVTPSWVWQLF